MTAVNLRCEYRSRPLGIDVKRPRLSWFLESEIRGQKQKAYRVLVASSLANLERDKGDLWDTGKVTSDETACIVYAGRPLKSGMDCHWKVRIWGAKGKAADWSEPARWTMGLLSPDEWQGTWIGFDRARREATAEGDEDLTLPPPQFFRKGFTLKGPVRRAMLYASALGWYEMHLNGHRIGEDYFTPGWTDYEKRVYYNTYDVTELLTPGRNAMGALLADGWYSGYIGWAKERDHYGKKPRLRAQLVVEYEDGSSEVVATDRGWRASTGPLVEADILMGETYDARLEMAGWDEPEYDAHDWSPVNVTTHVGAAIQAYPGVTVRVFRELRPVSVTEPKPGVFVFDMGSNIAGIMRLRVKGRRGTRVRLRHAERLNPDGTVYTTNLRHARAQDTYICKGGGVEVWEPRFTFHGFQYVEVTGYPGKPHLESLTGIELTSATPVAGNFKCSNGMLNKLYRNICQTQRANFIDVPTDCPQRDERLGWTGDAQIYVRTACMNSDVQAFFTKWLVDLEDAQQANGQFPCVAPLKVARPDGGPAWAEAGVVCPWTIYDVYGDRRVLEKHYDSMARFIDFCEKRSPGFLPPKKYFCHGDWLSLVSETPKDVIYTAYFALSARLMANAAEVLGKKRDAARYAKLYGNIKAAFNRAYVDADGRIRGNTQCVYVLALSNDLVDGDNRERAARYLVEDIEQRGWRLSTGFIGTKDLMLVLSKIGRTDVAYRLLLSDAFPSWGFSIKHGATSIWERWDGWTPEEGFQNPEMNSFAHYAFGAVAQWMFENVGGIRSDGAGFRQIIIRPLLPTGSAAAKLRWAESTYKAGTGEIVSRWRRAKDGLHMTVKIPPNTSAEIRVPAGTLSDVTEGGRPASKAEGLKFLRQEDDAVVFSAVSGVYEFKCRQY